MFNSLPLTKSYSQSLVPFGSAYAAYVAVDLIPTPCAEYNQAIKLIICTLCLLIFRGNFAFKLPNLSCCTWALLSTPVGLFVWVFPYWLISGGSSQALDTSASSPAYWILRTVNSVVIIAIAEELFVRAYLSEWFFQAGSKSSGTSGLLNALRETFDGLPAKFTKVPISLFSFLGAGLIFTVGHSPKEFISAILYYSVTHAVYYKTGSLTAVMLIHGLVNLCIALAVKFGGLTFLWFE
jgi:membrane protease YdiL (CAAX protease family)